MNNEYNNNNNMNNFNQPSNTGYNPGLQDMNTGYNPQPNGMNTTNTGYNPEPQGMDAMNTGYNPQPQGMNTMNTGYNSQPNGMNTMNTGYNPQSQGMNTMNTGYNSQPNGMNTMNTGYNPQPNGMNTMNTGYNPQPQGMQPNTVPMNSPYTNNNNQSKGKLIGIVAVIAVIIVIGVLYAPTLFGKSPKGEWTCENDTIKTMIFTSKDFTFSGTSSGFNVTMTGKYKIASGSVKPKNKKDGFKYTSYKVSNVKAMAGSYTSNMDSTNLGFVIGYSSDGDTIHYLSGENDTGFTCTKK